MLDNLLSGLIGALIGGLATFAASMWQIGGLRASERERRKLENLERIHRAFDSTTQYARDVRDEFLAVGRGDQVKDDRLRVSWRAAIDELRMLVHFYAFDLIQPADKIEGLLAAMDLATQQLPTFATLEARGELAAVVAQQAQDVAAVARSAQLKLLEAAVTIPLARRRATAK